MAITYTYIRESHDSASSIIEVVVIGLSWNRDDKKRYQGKHPSIFISSQATLDPEDYIDQFLRTRGYDLSDENRDKVAAKLEHAPERPHHGLHELNHWLDTQFKN